MSAFALLLALAVASSTPADRSSEQTAFRAGGDVVAGSDVELSFATEERRSGARWLREARICLSRHREYAVRIGTSAARGRLDFSLCPGGIAPNRRDCLQVRGLPASLAGPLPTEPMTFEAGPEPLEVYAADLGRKTVTAWLDDAWRGSDPALKATLAVLARHARLTDYGLGEEARLVFMFLPLGELTLAEPGTERLVPGGPSLCDSPGTPAR